MMHAPHREWLPPGAFGEASFQAPVADAVGSWSSAWFSGPPLRLLDLRALAPGRALGGARTEWRVCRDAVAVAHVPEILSALARRAMAADPGDAPVSDTDRELMEGFTQKLLEDLALRLEQALGAESAQPNAAPGTSGPAGALLISIGERSPSSAHLSVAIPLDALVRFRKGRMPPPRPPAFPLATMRRAVGGIAVEIEADLGRTELSVAELRGLSAGDVVVLDRRFGDPAKLFLRGAGAPFAAGTLARSDDALSLILNK